MTLINKMHHGKSVSIFHSLHVLGKSVVVMFVFTLTSSSFWLLAVSNLVQTICMVRIVLSSKKNVLKKLNFHFFLLPFVLVFVNYNIIVVHAHTDTPTHIYLKACKKPKKKQSIYISSIRCLVEPQIH